MGKEEMKDLSFPGYNLANCFCRETYSKGGVCILARNDIIYQAINLNKLCKEKVFEISALTIHTCSTKVIHCCAYRSPSENPNYFLQHLEKILKLIYQPTVSLVLCGDLNINYHTESSVKQNLESIMKTSNLTQVVTFPTRICNNKGTLIDIIFLDNAKFQNLPVHPFDSGLSDHVAQILTLRNITVSLQKYIHTSRTIIMEDKSIAIFQSHLREEAWDSVYNSEDVNEMFNNFHCILLRHFESSFSLRYKSYITKHNGWITKGIKISCQRKTDLYLMYRHSNNPQIKEYYKRYCAILRKVINLAKKLYYDKQTEFSSNRVKTTMKIIKDITGKTWSPVTNMKIKSDAGILTNINDIGKAFNIYFDNIAEDLNNNSSDVDKAWQSLKEILP